MEEKNEKPLIVPENCPPVEYLITGFTKTEASYVFLSGTVGAILGITIWVKGGNSIIGVSVFFTMVAIAVLIFGRNEQTENLIDKIRVLKTYRKSQKQYEYKYVNIWETEGECRNGENTKRTDRA